MPEDFQKQKKPDDNWTILTPELYFHLFHLSLSYRQM